MSIDRKKINTLAGKIRLALEMNTPPYSPVEAISKLNGTILYDIQDCNTDAYIEKIDEDHFRIHLNQYRHHNRERFTLAHELGHLFLHMGYIIDSERWNSLSEVEKYVFYRDNTSSVDEYEANEFAASFLMPRDEFVTVAEKHLDKNRYALEPISTYFGVSTDAVANRGKWLGIFQW